MGIASLLLVLALFSPAHAQQPEPKYEGKPLAYWIERFQNAEKDDDRKAAAEAVIAFGPDAAPAIPKVLIMLDDRSAEYREHVANMFCAIGPAAKGAVPDLIKLLEAKPPRDPHQVIRILCAIGPEAKDAIATMQRLVMNYLHSMGTSKDVELWSLSYQGADGNEHYSFSYYTFHRLGTSAVPMLLDMIEFDCAADKSASENGFESLQALGAKAKAAAPRLSKLLKHKTVEVRLQAARTLWVIAQDPAAISTLAALLKDTDPEMAARAAEELGKIGPGANEALPALRAALAYEAPRKNVGLSGDGPEEKVRKAAKSAIEQIEAGSEK